MVRGQGVEFRLMLSGLVPEPVIQSVETFDGPRFTYRLDASEIDRLRVALEDAGLAAAIVVPRRSRVRVGH